MGLRSHPTGSSTLEALTTLSFIRSDKPVFNTPAFRPCSPCYPTQAVAEPIVSHIRNPYLTFPGGVHHFHRRLYPKLGCSHGGFSDCGCMDPFRTRAPHQCTGAQGGNIGPQSLGYSITGSSCFDCYRQYHCCSLHQQTGWDPFPPPVVAGSGSVSVVSDSGHNSKSQTHSGLPKCDSRPLVSAKPAHHDIVESPPRSRESDIQTVGNSSSGQVCHSLPLSPVLPQWDLGIVPEALSKPPYEPLREASLKHLTLKTVFLLAMASGGRRSKLQALVFDPQYIQFKLKGAGVTLYFTPEFMRKNQRPNQVNDPWYIPAVPTGRPEFGAPNCPVRALKYYHRYMPENPELRKGRRCLFIP